MLRWWDDLPEFMKIPEVQPYYDCLNKKRVSLCFKRLFDIVIALILLVILLIPMLIIAILIKIDSPGPVFYRQLRITQYGKKFRIHKFRTMVDKADQLGSAVTVSNDDRITRIGKRIRKLRLDELPQLLDVLSGNMSFVGTRPESAYYVKKYMPVYYATLLLPAGITSKASILYKDEDKLLKDCDDVDTVYLQKVLPDKMKYNLEAIEEYSFLSDILTMFKTVGAVLDGGEES